MLDMLGPKERTKIRLSDLKGCRMTPIFFDTFFNLEKYLDHEQRDPFASQHDVDEDGNEVCCHKRFAAVDLSILIEEKYSGMPKSKRSKTEQCQNPNLMVSHFQT